MEQESKRSNPSNVLLFALLITNMFLLVLIILTISNLNSLNINNESTNEDIPIFEETKDEVRDIYCLRDYNGKIGIYKNESLIYTLDVYIFTLPEEDKKLLTEGIEVSNKEELYDLIELYY